MWEYDDIEKWFEYNRSIKRVVDNWNETINRSFR